MDQKLLIVDDCKENRQTLSAILSDFPIETHEADSGEIALNLVKDHNYFAILMDILMPNMDGFECAETIRKNKNLSHVPIIFVTSIKESERDISRGYELGAVDYMSKPVNSEVLRSKIQVFLNLENRTADGKKIVSNLKEEKHMQELMLNFIADGVISFDLEHNITYANSAACTLLTTPFNMIIGKSIKEFMAPNIAEEKWKNSDFIQVYEEGQCNHCDDTFFWRNKVFRFPVQYTQSSIYSADKIVGGMLVFQDITERKELENRLLKIAKYDELTGLANRSLYWEFLEKSIELARRKNDNVYVLFIDLDRFKDINDSLGHDAGDLLLISVSERLRHTLRSADLISRLGGDEFAIIIQQAASDNAVARICEKILSVFETNFEIFGQHAYLGCSIGIARFPSDGHDAGAITKSADTAMYSAKHTGKNTYKFFQIEMHKKVQSQLHMATELRVALTRNEIIPFFQTQIDAKTNTLVGAESLARWSSKGHNISPAKFIPVAEETGLISTLAQEILINVGRVISAIDSMLCDDFFRIAVNISAQQIQESHFARNILNFFDKNCINPYRIDLELTESSLMHSSSLVTKELLVLRNNGVQISIDDFGTGYSSLSYLKNLPIDTLKIDQSFVRDIGMDSNDEKIVKAIIQLAHSLDLNVIAEGVENKLQLDFLRTLDCDRIQGFLISKPCPSEEFMRCLREQRKLNHH